MTYLCLHYTISKISCQAFGTSFGGFWLKLAIFGGFLIYENEANSPLGLLILQLYYTLVLNLEKSSFFINFLFNKNLITGLPQPKQNSLLVNNPKPAITSF